MSRPGAYEKRKVEICNDCHHMRCNKELRSHPSSPVSATAHKAATSLLKFAEAMPGLEA